MSAKGFNLPELGEIGEKINADILENVSGIIGTKAVLYRDGIDQALVLIDERVPGLLITAQTLLYQPLVFSGPASRIVGKVSSLVFSSIKFSGVAFRLLLSGGGVPKKFFCVPKSILFNDGWMEIT